MSRDTGPKYEMGESVEAKISLIGRITGVTVTRPALYDIELANGVKLFNVPEDRVAAMADAEDAA